MAEASAAAPSELSADDAVLVELMQRRFDARTAGDAPTTHALREQIMGKFADKRIAATRRKAETEGQDEGASLDDGRTPPQVSPRCIEKFLNVELSSGVSRFNMPHDAQEHLSAAEHLLARAKQNNSDDLIEVASAETVPTQTHGQNKFCD